MDYVFFAFSSLCVSFSVILAFLLAARRDMQPRVLLLVLAALAGIGYFHLERTLFTQNLVSYYLGNMLPQIILFILLGLYIWRQQKT